MILRRPKTMKGTDAMAHKAAHSAGKTSMICMARASRGGYTSNAPINTIPLGPRYAVIERLRKGLHTFPRTMPPM